MSSVSKPRVRQNRHKQGLNQTLEKISADFRYKSANAWKDFRNIKCITIIIDDIYYKLNNSTHEATVTFKDNNYNSYSGDVIVSSSIENRGNNFIVTSIDNNAFYGCIDLTSVEIPNSVKSIGSYAFTSCFDLTSITIPNSVTSIGSYAFGDCSGLTSIIVSNENPIYDSRDNCNAIIETASNTLITGCQNTVIPNSVTSIGKSAFSGCSGLTSITIPNSVTNIGSGAFQFCSGLTSVEIPNSVTSIGSYAFSFCSGLTSITIPNSVTNIGSGAFYECSGLTSVEIGNGVTSISDFAFYGCTSMSSITCEATTPPSMGTSTFNKVDKFACTLYVPEESVETYKSAEQWKDFNNIVGFATGIDEIKITDAGSPKSYFDTNGREIPTLQKGINIVKYSDGTTQKVMK